MRVEAKLFELLTVFFLFATLLYGAFTTLSNKGTEYAGVTALVLTTGLSFIIATYFRFVARRLDLRPEDVEDAEISDGAGELGFFSPGSFWPVTLAAMITITATGMAFFEPWLIVLGVVLILGATFGLVFEYYLGPEKH
ncbi:MAG: cytochrome c oxidase subunit 4 [Nocardiaceae bacterium]|nr:cytochrome c oxidase subunit 4 [Nocardiaceae bacterium]